MMFRGTGLANMSTCFCGDISPVRDIPKTEVGPNTDVINRSHLPAPTWVLFDSANARLMDRGKRQRREAMKGR